MSFGEKLKDLRIKAGLSQEQLAKQLGITRRSIVYYETSERYPKKKEILLGIAKYFSVPVDFLVSEKEEFIIDAAQKYGDAGVRDANELIAEIGGLFAGGKLNEEDKDKVFKAITDLYFEAKNINKKYGNK